MKFLFCSTQRHLAGESLGLHLICKKYDYLRWMIETCWNLVDIGINHLLTGAGFFSIRSMINSFLIPILWLVFDIRHVLEITFLGGSPINKLALRGKTSQNRHTLTQSWTTVTMRGFPLPFVISRGHLLIIFSLSGHADAQKIRNIGCHWAPSRQRPFAAMTWPSARSSSLGFEATK